MTVQKIEEGIRSTVKGLRSTAGDLWSIEPESCSRPKSGKGLLQLIHARSPHFHDVSFMVPCSPGDNNRLGTDFSKYAS